MNYCSFYLLLRGSSPSSARTLSPAMTAIRFTNHSAGKASHQVHSKANAGMAVLQHSEWSPSCTLPLTAFFFTHLLKWRSAFTTNMLHPVFNLVIKSCKGLMYYPPPSPKKYIYTGLDLQPLESSNHGYPFSPKLGLERLDVCLNSYCTAFLVSSGTFRRD